MRNNEVEEQKRETRRSQIPVVRLVYNNFVCFFMLSIHNITLTLHLGDITRLPSWLEYIKHGPEHRGFVPVDHKLSHKLSLASVVAIPARRIARDGTSNHVRYANNRDRTLKLTTSNGYPKFSVRGDTHCMHRMVALLWGAPNNSG